MTTWKLKVKTLRSVRFRHLFCQLGLVVQILNWNPQKRGIQHCGSLSDSSGLDVWRPSPFKYDRVYSQPARANVSANVTTASIQESVYSLWSLCLLLITNRETADILSFQGRFCSEVTLMWPLPTETGNLSSGQTRAGWSWVAVNKHPPRLSIKENTQPGQPQKRPLSFLSGVQSFNYCLIYWQCDILAFFDEHFVVFPVVSCGPELRLRHLVLLVCARCAVE